MAPLTLKKIVSSKQKKAMRELQLICLPDDKPAECKKGGCAFAFYDGDTMVAFGLAIPSRNYLRTMYLARAGVHPDYRGRGLQRELIRLRESWAKNHGMQYAVTDTANSSIASMRSLMSAGYVPFWPQQAKPWGLKESVYWKKTL